MRNKILVLLFLYLLGGYSFCKGQYLIKIFVFDETTDPFKNIEGATILVDNKQKHKTNAEGFMVCKLSDGKHTVKVYLRRYKTIEFTVEEAATCLTNLQPVNAKNEHSGYSIHSEDGKIRSSFSFFINETSKADSLYELGKKYYSIYLNTDDDDSVNYERAYTFFKQAADFNHPEALVKLVNYYKSKGLPEEAMICLEKTANLDNSGAIYTLGNYYKEIGDYSMALNWLLKGAEEGNVSAQMAIGEMYEKGLGVEKDIDMAMMWYNKSLDKDGTTMADTLLQSNPLPMLPQQKHIAILIGNGDYETGRLLNVGRDWKDMNKILNELGFETISCCNVNKREFKQKIRDFRSKVKDDGHYEAILFYYAGHGVQSQGINYLVPIGDFLQMMQILKRNISV